MLRNHWLWLLLLASALLFAGCGGDDDDDDITDDFDDDDDDDDGGDDDDDADDYQDFLDALPDPESLLLRLPGQDEKSKAVGDTPELYEFTVDRAMDVNDYLLAVLSVIDEITSFSPSSFDGTTLIWGPWKESGLSMVFERFVMTNIEGNSFTYTYEWRDKNSTDENDWVAIWQGEVEASATTQRRGVGSFTIDYSAGKELWPQRIDATGSIAVEYNTLVGRQLEMEIVDFLPDDLTIPLDGDYRYEEEVSLEGVFEFDAMVDLEDDEDQWTIGTDVAEHFWVVTQWNAAGTGRGDLIVNEGNIPEITYEEWTAEEVTLAECWNDQFALVYVLNELLWDSGYTTILEEDGDVNDCSFAQLLPDVH